MLIFSTARGCIVNTRILPGHRDDNMNNKILKTIGCFAAILMVFSLFPTGAVAAEDSTTKDLSMMKSGEKNRQMHGLGGRIFLSDEDMSDKAGLGPRVNGFTNLINSKIELLENEIENSDDLSFIEEAETMIFELENVRNEMQGASNEDEFASLLNKFNSLMENSSEDLEQIVMGDQKRSVDRIVDVKNVSVPMNGVSNDMKSSILNDEREHSIKNVSSKSTIVNGNENKVSSSNSGILNKFVNKIMSFFEMTFF